MTARNDLDRLHLAIDVLDQLPDADDRATHCKQLFNDELTEHRAYITRHGDDMLEIRARTWPQP